MFIDREVFFCLTDILPPFFIHSDIARKAMTMEWMLPRQPSGRNTLLDCFTDFSEAMSKDITELHPEELSIFNHFQP